MVRVTAPPGKPRGNLESYSFPEEAEINKEYGWSMTVHNNGDASGTIGAGIGNPSGNPGNIVVTYGGQAFEIPPGQVLLLYDSVGVCSRINLSGKVKFMTGGTYTIRLMGLHQEDTEWMVDTYTDING